MSTPAHWCNEIRTPAMIAAQPRGRGSMVRGCAVSVLVRGKYSNTANTLVHTRDTARPGNTPASTTSPSYDGIARRSQARCLALSNLTEPVKTQWRSSKPPRTPGRHLCRVSTRHYSLNISLHTSRRSMFGPPKNRSEQGASIPRIFLCKHPKRYTIQ